MKNNTNKQCIELSNTGSEDARKGTAPFVGQILKEVMGIWSAHIRNISDFKSLTVLL